MNLQGKLNLKKKKKRTKQFKLQTPTVVLRNKKIENKKKRWSMENKQKKEYTLYNKTKKYRKLFNFSIVQRNTVVCEVENKMENKQKKEYKA